MSFHKYFTASRPLIALALASQCAAGGAAAQSPAVAPPAPDPALERVPAILGGNELDRTLREIDARDEARSRRAEAAAAAPARVWRHPRLDQLPMLLGLPQRLSVATTRAGGAEAPPVPSLRLDESMRKGVDESYDTKAAVSRVEAAEETVEASRGMLRPKVDLLLERGRGDAAAATGGTHKRETDSLMMRFPLIDRVVSNDVLRQEQLALSAKAQAEGTRSSAALDAASAYLLALQARLVMELSSGYEAMLQELLDYVSARAEAGGASVAERNRVRARVANARSTIADARANLNASLQKLQSLVGEAPQALELAAPDGMKLPGTAEEAKEIAASANFDLRSAAAERDAAVHEAASQRAKYFPRLEAQLIHRQDVTASALTQIQDNRAMLSMSWSIFNGGTDRAQMAAALARSEAQNFQREGVLRRLSQEIDAAYATLDAMQERFAAVREEVQSNASVVEAFRAQLVGGNRQLLDVLDAYQRLHQSRLDIVQLAITEAQNYVKVAHLTGELPSLLTAPVPRP
ncbi:MAG: TolC family protein [Xylophilus ampelinus]